VTLKSGTTVTAAVGVLDLTGTIMASGAEIDANSGSGIAVDLENVNLVGGTLGGPGTIATATGNTDSTLNGVTLKSGATVTAAVGVLDLTGTIMASGAEIDANSGSGIAVDLENVDLVGGTLGGSGKIATATGNSSSTLNGATLKSGTTVTAAVGTLVLTGTVTATGAEIDANSGSGIAVDLENLVLVGGTLGGLGNIATMSATNTFEGVTVASGTTVNVTDKTVLVLQGTITDKGTIALDSSGDSTELQISGNVVLNGSGQVTLTDNTNNAIVSAAAAAMLTNDDTISGAGTIGDANLTLVNNGTIDATGSHTLIIDTGTNSTTTGAGSVGSILVANNGILEASAGHTLTIDDNVLNNGTIDSFNSSVVTITGSITGTGSINIYDNAEVIIGHAVSSGQTVNFKDASGASTLVLYDSHDFAGTIAGLTEASTESQENRVDLKDLKFTSDMDATFSGGVLTITNGNGDSVKLHLSGSDGAIEIASDGSGGTLIDDPSPSGPMTIGSGNTLDISSAASGTVTFTNNTGNTGELILDDSKDFTGQIIGFAGDGTTANSDLIDLADVNFADVATSKTTYTNNGNGTGTLTLYNSAGMVLAQITFVGSYQLSNFVIETDGNGHTLIVDPPAGNQHQDTSAGSGPTSGVVHTDVASNPFTLDLSGPTTVKPIQQIAAHDTFTNDDSGQASGLVGPTPSLPAMDLLHNSPDTFHLVQDFAAIFAAGGGNNGSLAPANAPLHLPNGGAGNPLTIVANHDQFVFNEAPVQAGNNPVTELIQGQNLISLTGSGNHLNLAPETAANSSAQHIEFVDITQANHDTFLLSAATGAQHASNFHLVI
jgi:hypothetical protein